MNRFFQYLHAAFFVRERMPLLGAVPVNLLAVIVMLVLGLGHPAFWLLGICAETAFLWAMIGSKRFRNVVDAKAIWIDSTSKAQLRQNLIQELIPPHLDRHRALSAKLEKVTSYYEKFSQGDPGADQNLSNLETLETVFLKLLIARQHLDSADSTGETAKLSRRIAELKADIADDPDNIALSLRESKTATLELLEKRLAVFAKREESLEEIDSDLARIEAQYDLAADAAAIRAQPDEAKLDLDLASRMMAAPEYLDFGNGLTNRADDVSYLEREL